ncbi:MAG: alpha/beta fold hydrolase [Clostridia bacterium]|nr:alpha/beta fold hydrolase [Clostridia bacterium]
MIQTISIPDNEVRCLIFGQGKRPFVILPGLAMTSVLRQAAHHERTYAPFTETHTVYLFDRPSVFPAGYTFDRMADDLASAMKAAGISDADMLGVSMGGMLAQKIAADHPYLVHKLVLASSALAIGSPEKLKAWMKKAETENGSDVAKAILTDIHGGKDDPAALYHPDPQFGDWPPEDRARFLQEAAIALTFDGTRYVSRIRCPSLVLGAAGDKVCPVSAWKALSDALKGESHLYGRDFGHTFYTDAADFRARVLAFFLRDGKLEDDRRLVWSCGEEEQLISTPVFDLYARKETSADGLEGRYIAMKAPGWVMVVPVMGDSFVMVRQWRHGMRGLTDEFPGGVCDGGESPLVCAARELEEETGFRAGKLTVLGSCCPNPALQDNRVTVCLAEDLTEANERQPDKDERIGVRLVPRDELFRLFGSYDYQHALTGLALFLYARHAGCLPSLKTTGI